MTMERAPRPEALDLHGYVDGRLTPERRAEVAAWCAAHPQLAQRLAGWTRDAVLLRETFDPLLDEGLPSSLLPRSASGLRAPAAPEEPRRSRRDSLATRRGLIAVAAASFCLGGATALTVASFVARWGGEVGPLGLWLRSLGRFLP